MQQSVYTTINSSYLSSKNIVDRSPKVAISNKIKTHRKASIDLFNPHIKNQQYS